MVAVLLLSGVQLMILGIFGDRPQSPFAGMADLAPRPPIRVLSPVEIARWADLAGAFLNGAQFLNCAQLVVARNWQSAFRDETLGCGATIV